MIDDHLSVVDPLPLAFRHYRSELHAVLRACGVSGDLVASPAAEGSSASGSRVRRSARLIRWRLGHQAPELATLVLWPAFGLLDPLTWWRGRGRTWLIVHDPEPLRRQFGMGRAAAAIGRFVADRGVGVVVHSQPAADVLGRRGWSSELLPHPIRRPGVHPARGRGLSVIGQWKPVRSLEPLTQLADDPRWAGRRYVVGRDWPRVDGWHVDPRFVAEAELSRQISASACVILPYRGYFQSGISVRCLEAGVPVVGIDHPFLVDLYGSDWPGIVRDDDWRAAVDRVADIGAGEITQLRDAYWTRCVTAWRRFLDRSLSSLPR